MGLLRHLPLPPHGKKGWPWAEESPDLPLNMPNGEPWPKISIVTPSLNQGQFIEETIRSVLLQNYPNLEYVIIDGDSSDNSLEIIKKYEPWLTYWVSEKDSGQSHAINKGFDICSGDIFNWLCSDDIFFRDTFVNIASIMKQNAPCWIIGGAFRFDEKSKTLYKKNIDPYFGIRNFLFWPSNAISQSSVFWNRMLQTGAGSLAKELHYTMDIDLWFRFYKKNPPLIINNYLSQYRHHDSAKTTLYSQHHEKFMEELAHWTLDNLFHSDEEKIRQEVKKGIILMQEEMTALKRLRSHIILGRFMRLWKMFINKNLPV